MSFEKSYNDTSECSSIYWLFLAVLQILGTDHFPFKIPTCFRLRLSKVQLKKLKIYKFLNGLILNTSVYFINSKMFQQGLLFC